MPHFVARLSDIKPAEWIWTCPKCTLRFRPSTIGYQVQCFLCERGTTVGADFDLFKSFNKHKNLYKPLKEGEEKQINSVLSVV